VTRHLLLLLGFLSMQSTSHLQLQQTLLAVYFKLLPPSVDMWPLHGCVVIDPQNRLAIACEQQPHDTINVLNGAYSLRGLGCL
jgi:hypothetical protein